MRSQLETKPIGLLGGTFDPLHYGHLRLAEEARDALGLDRVLIVPCGLPPHRDRPVATAGERLEMARLGITGNPFFELETGEAAAEAPSYTVVTLERLRARFGSARALVLLVGSDAFMGLAGWNRWRELFSLAHLGVARRPGSPLDAAGMPAELAEQYERRRTPCLPESAASGAIVEFATTALDISASRIRASVARSVSVRYLLPDSVLDYIERHRLYRNEP
ncbi:MAG: nicotinate-nucleotide adenylyltransferase [Rhodocyclaceae bacterium]